MSDIACNLLDSGAKSRESICDSEVDFSGVGLGGDAVAFWETGLLAEHLVQLAIFAPSPWKISMKEA
jgi:hypothetical protein